MKILTVLFLLMAVVLVLNSTIQAQGMGTAFTYEGKLSEGGSPAMGEYDFEFKLFDDSNVIIGDQVGSLVSKENVPVEAGTFTVLLNFGNVFDGDQRWLQIGVRPGDEVGDYTTLSPLQELTPTPYALYALHGPGGNGFWSANGNDIFNSNSGNIGIGTSNPAGKLHVGTSPTYGDIIFLDAGGGQDDLSVDPDSVYTDNTDRIYIVEVTDSGVIPDKFKWSDDNGATWSPEFDMTTSWYDLSHGIRIKWDYTNGHYDGGVSLGDRWAWFAFSSYENTLVVKEGKVGIGTSSPAWELEVANLTPGDGAESAVKSNDTGGAIAAYSSTLGAPFAHYAGRVSLFSDLTTMGLDLRADGSTGDIRFYTGGPWPANERMRINEAGNVGIGTLNPSAKLSIVGEGSGDRTVYAYTDSDQYLIYAKTEKTDGTRHAIYATATGNNMSESFGVKGSAYSATGPNIGVEGTATANSTGDNYGVYGYAINNGTGSAYAGYFSGDVHVTGTVKAVNSSGTSVHGDSLSGIGVYGYTYNGTAIYGRDGSGSGAGYAGYFDGNVHVAGSINKSACSFKIDHPVEPETKYLYHSVVESPDMKNVYDGVAVLDGAGEVEVKMPEWFEALNHEFRYQLTCIGGFAPVYIAEKISNNQFKIAGGEPGMEVSWQVTGIRQDAYAEANRIPVEKDKPEKERGTYLHPEAFGLGVELGINYKENQRMAKERERMK